MTLILSNFSAEFTKSSDSLGKMDPYIIIEVGSQSQKSTIQKRAGVSPRWPDVFTFSAMISDLIRIRFLSKGFFGSNHIGELLVPVSQVAATPQLSLPFVGKKSSGQVWFHGRFTGPPVVPLQPSQSQLTGSLIIGEKSLMPQKQETIDPSIALITSDSPVRPEGLAASFEPYSDSLPNKLPDQGQSLSYVEAPVSVPILEEIRAPVQIVESPSVAPLIVQTTSPSIIQAISPHMVQTTTSQAPMPSIIAQTPLASTSPLPFSTSQAIVPIITPSISETVSPTLIPQMAFVNADINPVPATASSFIKGPAQSAFQETFVSSQPTPNLAYNSIINQPVSSGIFVNPGVVPSQSLGPQQTFSQTQTFQTPSIPQQIIPPKVFAPPQPIPPYQSINPSQSMNPYVQSAFYPQGMLPPQASFAIAGSQFPDNFGQFVTTTTSSKIPMYPNQSVLQLPIQFTSGFGLHPMNK